MRNWFENITAIVFISMLAGLAIAQRGTNKLPPTVTADAKFVVHIDLNAVKQTKLGAMLFNIAKQKALEEIDRKGGEEVALNRLKQTLGMDPFEDIQSITLSTDDLEEQSDSMLVVVRLKKTAGNLEGLALGLPEYEAQEHRAHTIHSASPPQMKGKQKFFGAIHGDGAQDRSIVLSPSLEAVQTKLDQLDEAGEGLYASEPQEDKLVQIQVREFPIEKLGKGPQAAVAKIVTSFYADVTCDDDSIFATATTTTQNAKQAEQLQQMSNGLMAMIDLAQSMEPNDKELQQVREVLRGIESRVSDNDVTLTLSLNSNKILEAISKELGIDLNAMYADKVELAKQKWERKKLELLKVEAENAMRDADAKLKEIEKQLEQIK